MAAPTPVTRQDPTGIMLREGYQSFIACALNPSIGFFEKEVQPAGWDGDEFVDITTMHNDEVTTKYPRGLKSVTDKSGTAAYDPAVLESIRSLINVNTTWTTTFPDGSTQSVYAALKVFQPQAMSRGNHPEAQFTIVATNIDSANSFAEAIPVIVSVSGT
jgi:hypothetical protein